ncbi:DUF2279 domain-containing protein [Fibrella sp. HMF5335]|uniref:DUF2279 domain-containing protein n=1 Tax=Fibrella rubiginis TaxID=2817060 RepID=A0A939GF48_9BACT|nr:DUF2279 domain-containing protein [Fibrella rubiginis]MBO0937834.1 DUF2279 domain-containing protein [Fibrella rubiginis]
MYHFLLSLVLLGYLLLPALCRAQSDSLPALVPPIATTVATTDSVLPAPSSAVPRYRTYLLAGTSLLTLGSTYAYLEKRWWSDGHASFHFDDGRDFRYASNVDKLGHFLGGAFTADAYYAGFRWAGVSPRRAEWYAVGTTALVQLCIEFKDGYAPTYGFSWADVTVGTLGGFWPMVQHRSPFLADSQLKVSYWKRTNKYWEHRGIVDIPALSIDDYINQAYWFSFSPRYLGKPGSAIRRNWPNWLQLSAGFGLDADTWSPTRNGEGGLWEFYLAPDLDLVKLFKPKKPLMRTMLHLLNYVKVPMPTVQLGPKPRLWWLYF